MNLHRRAFIALAGAAAAAPALAQSNTPVAPEIWADLARDVFKGRALENGAGLVLLDAPYRAEDAAIVPVTFGTTLPADDSRTASRLWLIVDENPAPVAGTFEIGPKSGLTQIATRIRVNQYSNVHVVAELSDGKLYAVEKYVKAAGGCSAPAAKRLDEAEATMGQMRFRDFAAAENVSSRQGDAQFMMRHPNNSGLQMDQVTHLYTPARFVQDLKIFQGDDLVLAMDGGISISEDPNFRFNFTRNGAVAMSARAVDTDGKVFEGRWPLGRTAS